MCGTPFLLRSSSLGRELDPLDIIYSRSLGFLSYRGHHVKGANQVSRLRNLSISLNTAEQLINVLLLKYTNSLFRAPTSFLLNSNGLFHAFSFSEAHGNLDACKLHVHLRKNKT
ncbi:hypothetical protein I3842_09G201900 [Carya illinoinensis]|uniref:Uncharacterized protein n=1 Tax=Carya illinoinensis TaxID=32201 RepID=A0A922JAA1_CARIL|nr:hypothetical protein I3842_09G201900 [Carya illinoinensis]